MTAACLLKATGAGVRRPGIKHDCCLSSESNGCGGEKAWAAACLLKATGAGVRRTGLLPVF